jgi:hypothetical protein
LSPADLFNDRQLPGAAVIGAVFVAASLFTDWQAVTLPVIRDGPADLGTAGRSRFRRRHGRGYGPSGSSGCRPWA